MAYTIELDFGLGWVDYSSSLYGRNPIRRQRAIYNDLKPVISTVKFQLVKSADLVNQLLLSSEDIPIRILSGGAAYFYGYVRPTIKATVKSSVGLEALDIEAVDLWYKLDRAVGTTRVISGWAISNPSSKSVSILHQLFYDAGILDSELSLAAITATIPYLTLTAGSGTYRSIIEQILAETGYSARVSAAGVVSLYDLGPSTITPALTLSSGASGNLADGYTVERKEATAEAVDVEYNSTKTLTAVMLYEDATGASAGLDASISVPAGTYYPVGAALGVSVKAAMEIEDYDIIAASSVTSDILYNGVLSIQEFVQSGKYILLRLYSASGAVITRLRGTGTAVVKGDLVRVVRENVAGTLKRDTVEFKYLADTPSAQRIARIRAARHLYGAFRWTLTTTELTLTPGDYVTLSEAVVLGASSTLRVVSVVDGPDPKTITIEAEGVVAYTATATTTSNETVQPPAQGPSAQAAETALKDSIALASTTLALSTAAAIRSRAGAVSPGTLTVSARTSLGDAYDGRIAIAVSSDGATYDDEMGIPSDPDGVTYLQDAWATTDGWTTTGGTLSNPTGVLRFTKTGASQYARKTLTTTTGQTLRVKVRYVVGSGSPSSFTFTTTNTVFSPTSKTIASDGSWSVFDAVITTGAGSFGFYLGSFDGAETYALEFDWVYLGTGAYAGYLSASDESSKDYTIPATMLANGILSYVASIRVRLYAAGGTTTLLGERLCSVSADPSTAASYLGIGILSALGTATFESATVDEDGDITVIGNVNQVYVGDTVINYASTGGVSTLGMYKWSGSAWVKTTTLAELGKAIPDFMGLSKAGISIPDATIVSLLIVQELLAQNATITGGLYIQSGGSIRGGDRYDQDGEIIDEDVSGFFISAGGACKFAGIEFDGEESGGVQWGCPTKVGTDLTLEDIGSPALASLSGTDFAFIDATLNTLRRYRWNGITFGQVGTGIGVGAIAGPALAALNYRDVAFVDSALDELRVYRWGTTEFALLGAGLSLAPMSTPALAAMNGTDVAFIDAYNEVLRLYRWSGSAFSLVGTGLSIPGVTTPALAALNGTDVVFCDGDLDVLRVYRFSGSGWTLLGGISVSGIGLPALAALNGTDVALADGTTDAVRLYRWTGTTFGKIYDAGTSGIGSTSTPAMTALNGTDVVIVDGYSNKLRMYRWPFSISRPYARKLTG